MDSLATSADSVEGCHMTCSWSDYTMGMIAKLYLSRNSN